MASLGAATYIGVGALVIIVSLALSNLRAFIFVGIIFMIIGVYRAVKGKDSTEHLKNRHTYHRTHPRHEQEAAQPVSSGGGGKTCFVCGARNAAIANFCGHCGHRLT